MSALRSRCGAVALAVLVLGASAQQARAQFANDNFADAQPLVGDFGTVDGDTSGFSAEPGEPNHAGFPAAASAWFKWTAPDNASVQFDTYGSGLDTVIAVYTASGSDVSRLDFVSANDEATPFSQSAVSSWFGPSQVRFNARAGQTYYLAVDGYFGLSGPFLLNWAYNSAGVFRFTSDFYAVSDFDSSTLGTSTTRWSAFGAVVTVTRTAGSRGRCTVDLTTEEGTAIGGLNYTPLTETLVFDEWEMSKTVVVPVFSSACIPSLNFQVSLSNPQLDPAESTILQPPRLDPAHSTSSVTILSLMYDPTSTNDPPCAAGLIVNFERSTYRTREDIGSVTIRVLRLGGAPDQRRIAWAIDSTRYPGPNLNDNVFGLQAGSDYATPNPPFINDTYYAPWTDDPADFDGPYDGILQWGQGDAAPKSITIPIFNDDYPEFNEDIKVRLYVVPGASDSAIPGEIWETTITILHDDLPAGSVDETHNRDYSYLTDPPINATPGADSTVYATAIQADGKALIAGDFTQFNTAARNRIARLDVDGQNDPTFDPHSGADELISSMALASAGRIVIGGAFKSYNGVQRYGIARLEGDGALDGGFNPGLGANGTVWAVAVQSDDKVLLGGAFTEVGGFSRRYIARLNSNGSVDESFNPTNTLNGPVQAIALALDDSIVIGGEFTQAGTYQRNRVARLLPDGSVDPAFDPRTGVTGAIPAVYALGLQLDGRILIGGVFDTVDLRARRNLARLNASGTIDESFDPGTGVDDAVYAIRLQPDGRCLIGGLFTSVNQTRRIGLARLFPNGKVDTSFMDPAYNHFAGFCNAYYNPDVNGKNFLLSISLQNDGNLIVGGSFQQVGGGRIHPSIQTNLADPLRYLWRNTDAGEVAEGIFGYSRQAFRNRYNVARLVGGDTGGPGNIGFVSSGYSIDESAQFLFVKTVRENGTLGTAETTFSLPPRAPGPGVAETTTDYIYNRINPVYDTSWNGTRNLADGTFGTNNLTTFVLPNSYTTETADDILVTVPRNPGLQGDRTARFQLDVPSQSDVFYLGGENVPLGTALGQQTADLTINDVDKTPGVIGFALASYSVNENDTYAVITLTRTNGSFGRVTVRFATTNGSALHGVDYTGVTNTVVFQSGVTTTNVLIPVKNNSTVQQVDRTVSLYLASPTGPAGTTPTLGLSNAVLSIVDDDFLEGRLNLTQTAYATNETAGAVRVTVTRSGGNLGVLDVQLATYNGTALAGVNYTAVTTSLHWDSGDSSPRHVDIPLLPDGLVTPNKDFGVRIFSPTVPGALGTRVNALLTILNQDFYGSPRFSVAAYNVNEKGGYATVTVQRVGGSSETISVNYATANGTAVGGGVLPNYTPASGTLTFGPGVVSRSFNVPILDDGVVDPQPFFFSVTLSGLTPAGASLGSPSTATVNIVDAQSFNEPAGSLDPSFSSPIATAGFNDDVLTLALQPEGKILAGGNFTLVNGLAKNRLARLLANGDRDEGFMVGLSGANATVRAVLSQTDTRVVVGGAFTTFNGVNRNALTRLNYDGTLDTSFNTGSGADSTVYGLAEAFVNGPRKLYAVGSFNTFRGITSPRIVRLNDDGTVDAGFNVLGLGADDIVYAVAVYPTNTLHAGKVLIGGAFLNVNGVPRARIARLNPDGSLDTTFNPSTGADNVVRAITLQPDGRVLIGGDFLSVNGQPLNRLARLNVNGSVDTGFNLGLGINGVVYGIGLQEDNRVVVVGDFSRASGVTRSRITRLLPDGTVDPNINFGSGANGFIAALAIQPNGRFVIGGGFTLVQGQTRNRIARLYGSSITGSGQLEFASPTYVLDENGTNVTVTVRRIGGTSGTGPSGADNVTATFRTFDGTAVSGVNYFGLTNTLVFPLGEVEQQLLIPVFQDYQITPDLTANLALSAVSAPAALGPQPTAVLTLRNVDSGVNFSSATYSRNEDAIDGLATITLLRQGSTRGTSAVTFLTTTNGTAVTNLNYLPLTNVVTFLPGETAKTVKIPVLRNPLADGDKTVAMELNTPISTLLFTPYEAVLTIIDVDRASGQLQFAMPAFFVGEGDGEAVITLVRTNGRTHGVSVNFATVPGTATPGLKYVSTNGLLTFADGEVIKSFGVRILDGSQVEGDQSLSIVLSNPSGGATFSGPSEAPLTISDNDVGLTFSSPAYVVNETETAVFLNVLRLNASNLVTSVNFRTVDGTARAGTNYVATSGPLTFTAGETVKSISIPILRDPRVTGNLSFSVLLTNGSGGVQLVSPNPATVVIVDADSGISLTNAALSVMENGTNLLVTVVRSNASSGLVTVNYATADDTAVGGIDYLSTSGTLIFSNGVAEQTFTVPIIDNALVQSDRTFRLELFNPSFGAQLLAPSSAVATIVDNDAGLRFSSPSYTILENDVTATITVVRANFTNSAVAVAFTTENGTGLAGTDYFPTNGVLVFTNGVVERTFTVTIIDDNVVKGDRTVLLKLRNPAGDAAIINPGAATLTIFDNDGSLVVPAGSALLTETNGNGVIDPGEPVTVLFGFRNSAGTNAANVTATLLATNGVVPTTTSQNYGPLPVNGPAVSRPFSFRSSGTNGQNIAATFRLADGPTDLGLAVFNYAVGTSTKTLSNATAIVINDAMGSPAAAAPYPSSFTVSGVDGLVNRLTVTLTNLTHGSVGDVGVLLVGPAGQSATLMANAGGLIAVNGITLTFDDQATNSLPLGSAPTNGNYKPTTYAPVPPFPAPAPPQPYASTLGAFTGSNPNGLWSLYVLDDLALFGGAVSNGWSMTFVSAKPLAGAADLSLAITATPEPVIATSNVTYRLVVTNHGPSSATNIVVSDTLPANATFVSATPSQGTAATNASGALVWSAGLLAKDASASLTLVLKSGASGTITNTATATSGTLDTYLGNNTASVATIVEVPTADLALGMDDAPDPVVAGWPLTYTLGLTNLGPATATAVTVTNKLPPGVAFVSIAASQGAAGLSGTTAWVALGDVGTGARASVTLIVRPFVTGTLNNSATATSPVIDPLKGNNTASVKTTVLTGLTAYASGSNIVLTHPGLPGTILETTPGLTPPVTWTPLMTNPPPVLTLPATSVNQFFRLRPPGL